MITPENVTDLERCSPGTGQPAQPGAPQDLYGLYEAGQQIHQRLFEATTPEEVIQLLHPANILPARTYLRLTRLTEGTPATAVAFGEEGAENIAFGPEPQPSGEVVAFGFQNSAGTEGEDVLEFVRRQQETNNITQPEC
jgi:hypothetical protein